MICTRVIADYADNKVHKHVARSSLYYLLQAWGRPKDVSIAFCLDSIYIIYINSAIIIWYVHEWLQIMLITKFTNILHALDYTIYYKHEADQRMFSIAFVIVVLLLVLSIRL